MTTQVMLIPGTWGWQEDAANQPWWNGGGFSAFLTANGFTRIGGDNPWTWTTDVNGWLPRLKKKRRHKDWDIGGRSLYQYLVPPVVGQNRETYVPIKDRNLIAHSHGLQVVLYACAAGLKINTLVSVCSPVRDDMMEVAQRARPNIKCWIHVSDPSILGNKWAWLGTLFDGEIKWPPEFTHPLADDNILLGGIGHSKLLDDPAHFYTWISSGIFAQLKERAHVD